MVIVEVLVLLDGDGDDLPTCEDCAAPMFSQHSRYYSDEVCYREVALLECIQGHALVVVLPVQDLTPEMKDLLS